SSALQSGWPNALLLKPRLTNCELFRRRIWSFLYLVARLGSAYDFDVQVLIFSCPLDGKHDLLSHSFVNAKRGFLRTSPNVDSIDRKHGVSDLQPRPSRGAILIHADYLDFVIRHVEIHSEHSSCGGADIERIARITKYLSIRRHLNTQYIPIEEIAIVPASQQADDRYEIFSREPLTLLIVLAI